MRRRCRVVCMPLPFFAAAVYAFVPLQPPALRNGAMVRRPAPDCSVGRCRIPKLVLKGSSDSMGELMRAAAETREKLQAGAGQEATGEMLTLSTLTGDRTGGDGTGMRELFSLMEQDGARVEDDLYAAPEPMFKMLPKMADRAALRVASFADGPIPAPQVLEVASKGIGLADFSHHGIIAVNGADRYRFVNGLCTNKVLDAKPGQVLASCFTNKLGRTVDLTTLVILQDSILVLCSANRLQHLYQSFDALIFPKDDVQIEDLSLSLAQFRLVGPKASSVIREASGDEGDIPVAGFALPWGGQGLVVHGNGLASPGLTVIVSIASAAAAWRQLASAVAQVIRVCLPCVFSPKSWPAMQTVLTLLSDILQHGSKAARLLGSSEWEVLRISDGVPAPDRELTTDHNPLEAALWHTISFDKGCYVGQETIARLKTYDGVKQELWGLSFVQAANAAAVAEEALLGAKLSLERDSAAGDHAEAAADAGGQARGDGRITSVLQIEGEEREIRCLAYVKMKAGGTQLRAAEGRAVVAKGKGLPDEGMSGTLVALPYATRSVRRLPLHARASVDFWEGSRCPRQGM